MHCRHQCNYSYADMGLTLRLRMQAAELGGQSAERLRLARAALCRHAPLRLTSPTDLLQMLRLLDTGIGLLFSSLCSIRARLALQNKNQQVCVCFPREKLGVAA